MSKNGALCASSKAVGGSYSRLQNWLPLFRALPQFKAHAKPNLFQQFKAENMLWNVLYNVAFQATKSFL
jgi:hypothetical protein